MSWSLAVFSPRVEQVTIDELTAEITGLLPVVAAAASPPSTAALAPTPNPNTQWTDVVLVPTLEPSEVYARIQAVPFAAEREEDPELLDLLELEVVESDADDGTVDEEFTDYLRQTLRDSQWHYLISVRQNDWPEQEQAVVRAAYALTRSGGGLVHDLQSGAWMDAELFESLLDAYGVSDFS